MISIFSSARNKAERNSILYTGQKAIEIKYLTAILGQKTVLNNINLSFKRQEFTVLLGPNGTGKSTLLKALTGEIKMPGEFTIFGKPWDQWPAEQLAKHLGVLPQSSSLSFNFMAKEVIELGGIGLAMSASQLEALINTNMHQTDVKHLAMRDYPTLSGGEKQRVHLARVLTQLEQSGENKILLLDEPTSALDIHHQHSTLRLARQLANQGATVVAVLHDLNMAAQYADRIVILNEGRIVTDDTPKHALKADIIESVYRHKVEIISHPTYGHPVVIAG